MKNEDTWNRSPYCCVCGARTPVRVKEYAGKNDWYWNGSGDWKEEIVGDASLLTEWRVYKFCGTSCREVWGINPMAYENRVSYVI